MWRPRGRALLQLVALTTFVAFSGLLFQRERGGLLFQNGGLLFAGGCISAAEKQQMCRPPPQPAPWGNGTLLKPLPVWIPPGWRFAKRMRTSLVGSVRLYTPRNESAPGPYGRASSTTLVRDTKFGGFWAVTRHVSYCLHDKGHPYFDIEVKGRPISHLTLLRVGDDLRVDPSVPVRELSLPGHLVKRRPNETIFDGLEDPRIVSDVHGDRLFITAVQHQMIPGRDPKLPICRIALLSVDPVTGTILNGTSFGSPVSPWRDKEKSWLVFPHPRHNAPGSMDMLAVYEFHPFTVVNLTAVVNDTNIQANFDGVPPPLVTLPDDIVSTPSWFRTLRGSAGPLRWRPRPNAPEELLLLVHEQELNGPLIQFYTHRFITLDPVTFEPLRMSSRWVLHGRRIEYVIGLELGSSPCCGCDKSGKNAIILGYSIMDREAWVGRMCSSVVDGLLKTRSQDERLWLGAS